MTSLGLQWKKVVKLMHNNIFAFVELLRINQEEVKGILRLVFSQKLLLGAVRRACWYKLSTTQQTSSNSHAR